MNPKGNPQNLKPFQPGQSGNPNGRPKGSGIRFHLRKKADEIPPEGDGERTRGEILADDIWEDALKKGKERSWLAREIALIQVDGHAVQPIQVEPINIHFTYTDKSEGEKDE